MYLAFVQRRLNPLLDTFIAICCLGGVIGLQPGLFQALTFTLGIPAELLTNVFIPVVLILQWKIGNGEAAVLLLPALLHAISFLVPVAILAACCCRPTPSFTLGSHTDGRSRRLRSQTTSSARQRYAPRSSAWVGPDKDPKSGIKEGVAVAARKAPNPRVLTVEAEGHRHNLFHSTTYVR